MTKAFCVYDNSYYTPGSVVCQEGVSMTCTIPENGDPYWKDSGRRCEDTQLFDSDEARITVTDTRLRTTSGIRVDYSDGYKIRYRSNDMCQFTIKFLNNGATRIYRMDDRRAVLFSQLPRTSPDYKNIWEVVNVEAIDPNWGRDVLGSLDQHIIYDSMLWVTGSGQAYTTITYEDVQPHRTEIKTKVIPPGAHRHVGIRGGGYDCKILSAHLDDDFIRPSDTNF